MARWSPTVQHCQVPQPQFRAARCIFGPEPSSRTGEHGLTAGFLRRLCSVAQDPLDQRYELWVGGAPVLKRDGLTQRSFTSMPGVKLPMCVEHNGMLAHRFEGQAAELAASVFSGTGPAVLDSSDAAVLRLWLVKTWLLLAHPEAHYVDDQVHPKWESATEDLWSWMISNRPPPEGLSLWLNRRDEAAAGPMRPRVLPLPVVVDGSRMLPCLIKEFGVNGFDLTLVYHHRWPVDHPLEAEGRAVRIWPPPRNGGSLDLQTLPPVPVRDTVWLAGPTLTFEPGRFATAALPPLTIATEFADVALMAQLGIHAVDD
jgi:hypothetical protein